MILHSEDSARKKKAEPGIYPNAETNETTATVNMGQEL